MMYILQHTWQVIFTHTKVAVGCHRAICIQHHHMHVTDRWKDGLLLLFGVVLADQQCQVSIISKMILLVRTMHGNQAADQLPKTNTQN